MKLWLIPPEKKCVSCELFDRKVRLYGNVAVINGRSKYLIGEKVLAEVYHGDMGKGERKVDV